MGTDEMLLSSSKSFLLLLAMVTELLEEFFKSESLLELQALDCRTYK
jgi:hypothetical protein